MSQILIAADMIPTVAGSAGPPANSALAYFARGKALLRRHQSAAGRTMAGRLLELATGVPDRRWHFSTVANGRPVATLSDGRKGPDVSIAHSAEVVCCAVVLDGCIGIDVERARPDRQYVKLAETFFSVPEQRTVARDGFPAFLACWVLREAYAKATGAGWPAAVSRDGRWTISAHHRVNIVTVRGRQWIVGHRACGDQHFGFAWRPSSIDELMLRQADVALETAAARLTDIRAGT